MLITWPSRASLVVLVLLTLAVLPGTDTAAADDEAAPTTVTILTEVWRATDADLVAKIEAATTADPADAAAVHALIAAAGEGKAERISRFFTTTLCGKPIKHDDVAQVPVTTSVRTTGGTVRGGFGGFQQQGTRLSATATEVGGGQLAVSIQLSTTVSGKAESTEGGATVPGAQNTTTIAGDVAAPSGVLRMFQSSTRGSATFVVFVKVTRL